MNKTVLAASLAATLITLGLNSASFAAEKKAPASAPAQKAAQAIPSKPKPNFGMIAGSITSIDDADPSNIKLMVKSEPAGEVRTVVITPWTNITKVTDASDLKKGEHVRMMTRKVDDKDMAMGIMFGKIKNVPPPAKNAAPAQKSRKSKKAE